MKYNLYKNKYLIQVELYIIMFNAKTKTKNNSREISKRFVEIYFEFLEFVKLYSNKNTEFLNFYQKNKILKKANIGLFIKMWYTHISSIYFNPIMEGNIDYFLNKNYDDEKNKMKHGSRNIIQDCVVHMKNLYENLEKDIINVFIDYMQKLTYLSALYHK